MQSCDKTIKYLMVNSMSINIDVFDTFMKRKIVGKKYYNLVITI